MGEEKIDGRKKPHNEIIEVHGEKFRKKVGRATARLALPAGVLAFYERFMWTEPINLQNPDTTELRKRTEEFFEYCSEQKYFTALVTSYAIALGHSYDHIKRIVRGTANAPKQVQEDLRSVYRIFEDILAQRGLNDPFSSTMVIWSQKNYFDYRDNQEITIQHTNLLTSETTSDDVKRKYMLDSVPQIDTKDVIPAEFVVLPEEEPQTAETAAEEPQKKKRGRPRKNTQ